MSLLSDQYMIRVVAGFLLGGGGGREGGFAPP